jgi:hypothetical protein
MKNVVWPVLRLFFEGPRSIMKKLGEKLGWLYFESYLGVLWFILTGFGIVALLAVGITYVVHNTVLSYAAQTHVITKVLMTRHVFSNDHCGCDVKDEQ